MTTTISYPADPVTNGATEIQATTFNAVAADYAAITWAAAKRYITDKVGQKFPYFPVPKDGQEDPAWVFYLRKDLAGSSAAYRNLIGIQVVREQRGANVFSGPQAGQISVPIVTIRAIIHNWFPVVITLTDTTPVAHWTCCRVDVPLIIDPETGTYLYGLGTHQSLTEANGFLLLKVAAAVPTLVPALAAASGLYPLG